MDFDSLEDSAIVKAVAVLVAVSICVAICLRYALNHSLGAVNISMRRGFIVVEHVDRIVDALDQLKVSQRALLSIGGDRFSEGVAENVTGMLAEVDTLRQLKTRDPLLKRQIARVTRSVNWVLDLVGKTNELQRLFGAPAALALFDADGDNYILTAKLDAIQLKQMATDSALHRVRAQRRLRSVLEVLF
jgi:CHASE3 domain sensor protein